MTIVFYNPEDGKLYICTKTKPMQTVDPKEPNVLDHIPASEDILYVQNGHIVSKVQFADWLAGKKEIYTPPPQQQEFDPGFRFNRSPVGQPETPLQPAPHQLPADSHKLFIHPTKPGAIRIEDIQNQQFPEGIELRGKWDFLAVDDIGQEVLEESLHFRTLMAKGKVEIVNHEYVLKNQHRKRPVSPADRALDAILIQDQRQGAAQAVAAAGGLQPMSTNDGPIEIFVE